MGGDGGTVPRRSDLVKVKGYKFARGDHQGGIGSKPNLKIRTVASNDLTEHTSRYKICALSQLPLEHPVVCSSSGDFFTKEKILQALLHKSVPARFGLTSLKQLHSVSRDFSGVCQVSDAPLGSAALLLRPCGCVLSVKSEMAANSECPQCGVLVQTVLTLAPAEVRNSSQVDPAPVGSDKKRRKLDPIQSSAIDDLLHS